MIKIMFSRLQYCLGITKIEPTCASYVTDFPYVLLFSLLCLIYYNKIIFVRLNGDETASEEFSSSLLMV